jgi:hypothetical protein
MKLLEPSADDASEIRKDLRQVVGQKRAKGADESNTLSTTPVKPVEAVPVER